MLTRVYSWSKANATGTAGGMGFFGQGNFGQTYGISDISPCKTSVSLLFLVSFCFAPLELQFVFFFYRPAPPSSVVLQPVAVTNPFGTLPAMPQISINQSGNSASIQYGISSLPVSLLFLLQHPHSSFFFLTLS